VKRLIAPDFLHLQQLTLFPKLAWKLLYSGQPLAGLRLREKMNSTVSVIAGRQRRSRWLPLLVFLFVIAWGLLTTLVVLQDRTIDAQADVIHGLLKENQSLRKAPASPKQHGTQSSVHPKAPSSQGSVEPKVALPAERLQKDAAQIPSSQKRPQSNAKADRKQHNAGKRSPFRPPAEMTDPSDTRRTVFSI
jgi:hypothetical protein